VVERNGGAYYAARGEGHIKKRYAPAADGAATA
jgi:hypothetical protein